MGVGEVASPDDAKRFDFLTGKKLGRTGKGEGGKTESNN